MTSSGGDRNIGAVLPGGNRHIDQLTALSQYAAAAVNGFIAAGPQIVQGEINHLGHLVNIEGIENFYGGREFEKATNHTAMNSG